MEQIDLARNRREKRHSRQKWEDFWDEKRHLAEVYSNAERVVSQIRATGSLRDKWILEVGAGSGRDAFQLVEDGAKVICLDYSEKSLQVIAGLAHECRKPIYLVRADAFHLPFKKNALDWVFHQGLLEHFTHPQGLLAENFRVLRENGFAVADVPQKYHLYTVVKHILILFDKWFAGWETEFSHKQLQKLFENVGFQVYRCYGDWMRPSFGYRLMREILKKVGLRLPLYPIRVPILSSLRARLRTKARESYWALYTFMDIGVIGIKKRA